MYLPRFELNWTFAFFLSIHHFLSFFCVSLLHHFLFFLLVCVCEPFFTNSHLSFFLLLVCVCMPFVTNSHLSFFLLCVGPFHNFLYFFVRHETVIYAFMIIHANMERFEFLNHNWSPICACMSVHCPHHLLLFFCVHVRVWAPFSPFLTFLLGVCLYVQIWSNLSCSAATQVRSWVFFPSEK